MSRSFGGLYFTRRNHINSKFSHSREENNVSSANAVPQRVVSIQFVEEGDVTDVFEDHREVQIDEYETDSDKRNQILKNIQQSVCYTIR